MKTSDVLNRAADLIEERGWSDGSGWVTDETAADAPLCIEGGIMAALGLRVPESSPDDHVSKYAFEPLVMCSAYRAVVTYLGRDEVGIDSRGISFTGQPLYWWNDDGRTAAEVIETLRAAAVIEAVKETADEQSILNTNI